MCYELNIPYRDGTTHTMFEPLDFIAMLAALVTKPRVNLTRFHGVFSPHGKHGGFPPNSITNVRFYLILPSQQAM